jgi:TolA-binding protein
MRTEDTSMERFSKTWARVSAAAVPPFDVARSAERLAREMGTGSVRRASSRRRWLLVAAAVLGSCLLAVVAMLASRPGLSVTIDGRPTTEATHFGGPEAKILGFAGGSTVAVAPDSRVDVLAAGSENVAVVLKHGTADFDVVRHANATWSITAGPFVVRVVGTAFRVEWSPNSHRFSVSVTRGKVIVTGPLLDGEQAVSAGVTCSVDLGTGQLRLGAQLAPESVAAQPVPAGSGSAAPPPVDPAPAGLPATPAKTGAASPARPSGEKVQGKGPQGWRELEREGQFDRAVEAAVRGGLDEIYDLASTEDLMSLARAARLVGRGDISTGALLSCRKRFPGTRDASMAAYLLGRNASPPDAVRWFSAYLAEEPSGAWAREAMGRLVEAHFAAGNKASARDAAQKYLNRYPSGPHADFAKMVLAQ